MSMLRCAFAFENLGPRARPKQTRLELGALANNVNPDERRPRPKGIGLCETIHHDLTDLWHYGLPIRDRTRLSRANLALYVLDRLDLGRIRWHDLAEQWPRTEHPGIHEPRSILDVEVEDWRIIVAHAPPVAIGTGPARREWLDAMVELLSGPTPVLALTDPNGLGAELVRRLAKPSKGTVVTGGTPVEAVHGVGIVLDSVHAPGRVNGVPMLTDHRRALLGRARRREDGNK